MIYHCCGDCGERWLIGNPRTCKCPEEKPQRTWVGLTWDDVPEADVGNQDFRRGAMWAVDFLKEKNT